MSDNLGYNQSRVLDSEDRSFESVTYQWKKPPLSSEKNLDCSLYSGHAQGVAQSMVPSGMYMIGDLRENISENLCSVGDILTSPDFSPNTFKLIATDQGKEKKNLIAWVNGWKLLLQGSDSLDENNIIKLDLPPTIGYRIDFVFLEVWRKLIYPTDTIHKYGNFQYGGVNPTNDLIDPAIGIETSLRIQTQYRIRVAQVEDWVTYPYGFDPNSVFVQGPLDNPVVTCSQAYFTSVPGDPGLWRAGAGDKAAQDELGTVDGYTYAIPICAVNRRNTNAYLLEGSSNGAGKSLADYRLGEASDRPDNQYNDWVESIQILDMRNRVSPSYNFKEVCESSFQKLVAGKLRGRMTETTLGEDHFGVVLVQADAVSNVDKAGSLRISRGDGVRRMFSNAEKSQSDSLLIRTVTDKTSGISGSVWATGDQVQVSAMQYPIYTVISGVGEVYNSSGPLAVGTDYTVSGVGTNMVTITIPSGSSVIGDSLYLTVDYTINFASGSGGLSAVPNTFLEFSKEDLNLSIASQDADIRVRMSPPVVIADSTHFNMLSNHGGLTTEPYDFGHQMIFHKQGSGLSVMVIDRKINEYDILGVVSVRVNDVNRVVSSVSRLSSTYTIDLGTIVALTDDVEFTLYTGVKYFATNKQGRGITDTFEMLELTPLEAVTGSRTTFTLESTNKAIQAIGGTVEYNGNGMAYVNGQMTELTTTNTGLPTDSTKSRATINFSVAPSAGYVIEVPVMVKSAITPTEGYTFYYEKTPYQGLLDGTCTGAIEAVGTALTTTAGSGAITNLTYMAGAAKFTADSSIVEGFNTDWLSHVKTGYEMSVNSASEEKYEIAQVYNNTTIFLSALSKISTPGPSGNAYTIEAMDQPSFGLPNIIDRLPTFDSKNDGAARSESISTLVSEADPVLETRIISKTQDMLQLPPNTVTIGSTSADRGRTQVKMPEKDAPIGLGNLGLHFEKLEVKGSYQKTYQSYILNKNNDGILYLMVVGSETGSDSTNRQLSEHSDEDSVDIFELPGRLILNRRTQ